MLDLKICKPLVVFFYCVFSVVINIKFGYGEYGYWYVMWPQPIQGPLLAENVTLEQKIEAGWGCRNLLLNEKNGRIYINNLFPVTNHPSALDLARIFEKKEVLTNDEFKKINDSWHIQNGSEGIDGYISSLEKFVDLVIAYLNIWEDKGASIDVFTGINEKIRTFKVSKNVQAIVQCINAGACNNDVKRLVHTERLLLFDEYYTYLDSEEGPFFGDIEPSPKKPLVICSHFDMCESCEALMLKESMEISDFSEFQSHPYEKINYKILVGSFSFCKTSSKNIRVGNKDVLKMRLKFYNGVGQSSSSSSGIKRSSSQDSSSTIELSPPTKKSLSNF